MESTQEQIDDNLHLEMNQVQIGGIFNWKVPFEKNPQLGRMQMPIEKKTHLETLLEEADQTVLAKSWIHRMLQYIKSQRLMKRPQISKLI